MTRRLTYGWVGGAVTLGSLACGGSSRNEADASVDLDSSLYATFYLWCSWPGGAVECCNCAEGGCRGCIGGELHCTANADPFGVRVMCGDGGTPDAVVVDSGVPSCGDPVEACTTEGDADQVCVPGGYFVRGADSVTHPESAPAQVVYVSPFWMDIYEVTLAEYRDCVAAGFCAVPAEKMQLAYYRDTANDNKPMIGVPLREMERFCERQFGRLPTEAEWERAARGDDSRTYPWGEETGCEYANWASCTGPLTDVGSYPAGVSPYGIYDLIGNATEWTSDVYRWGYDLSGRESRCDPRRPVTDPALGESRAVRGCGRGGIEPERIHQLCTTFYRDGYGPGIVHAEVGFRCVRDGL